MVRLILASFAVLPLASCVFLPRDAACVTAEACDAALERPFNDFKANDKIFGDNGTCWQNAETAAPCVLACNDFLVEQIDIAKGQGNDAVIEACGGDVDEEEDAGEGEGEGE